MDFTVEKFYDFPISQFNEDLLKWFEQNQFKRESQANIKKTNRRGRKFKEEKKEDSDQIKTNRRPLWHSG